MTLAIKGGKPVRENKIYYGRQWIDEDDIKAVSDVLRGDYITSLPENQANLLPITFIDSDIFYENFEKRLDNTG